MKKLTRIRLINWHYFENETISTSGSFLVSGDNASGKSTILDAIQLVLTTNTKKFNTAANERSKRTLKGYVRCKTGSSGDAYVRKGSVITYAALEFFEERTGKYFTIGIKIDSPDEESRLRTKWFNEECKLEALSFVTKGRPSTDEEFRNGYKKVNFFSRNIEAKSVFRKRLGNLEERFFDMIPKSLAFKPMDNVKDFINKFILSEKTIEVSSLRSNIETLKNLEDMMDMIKDKIDKLGAIIARNNEIILVDREMKTNEVMIQKAELESLREDYEKLLKQKYNLNQRLITKEIEQKDFSTNLENERNRLTNLNIALGNNETTQLISETRHKLEMLEKDEKGLQQNLNKLEKMLKQIIQAMGLLEQQGLVIVTKQELLKIKSFEVEGEEKSEIIYSFKKKFEEVSEDYYNKYFKIEELLEIHTNQKIKLEKEIRNLKNKKLNYPPNTTKLKKAIEEEFSKQEIDASVRIFAGLLEIRDSKWRNSVEGYLNTQRFNIIVDPKYYRIALEVYNRLKSKIHTVGLVNTAKLDMAGTVDTRSLAYVIESDNPYAKAYAAHLLNRVICCEDIHRLKDHKVGITPGCMVYQGYAIRKINEEVYSTPYIGANAYKVQLKNKEIELAESNMAIREYRIEEDVLRKLKDELKECKMDVLEETINVPKQLRENQDQIARGKSELKEAEQNLGYIKIQLQIKDCEKDVQAIQKVYEEVFRSIGEVKSNIKFNKENIKQGTYQIRDHEKEFNALCDQDAEVTSLGLNKFNQQIQTKSPGTIVKNFSPLKVSLDNRKSDLSVILSDLQVRYCSKFDCDFGTGNDQMDEYIEEEHKLKALEIIKHEADLDKAKENCQLEFKESFLARLKENIETAQLEFRELNKALKGIYYGHDSYKFEITKHSKKKSIYDMIMSDKNIEGFNIWTGSFQEEYKEEMDDLFHKLTAYDDQGEKVLAEYTDYRNYLDYDITIEKKDGTTESFSKTYGEKSGGETQTPYYVAIAASFVQLYKRGDTVRIIMLDEAFDKMDDDRIEAMMDFFNSQGFQIILATPPPKMEIIGEKVDDIFMAMREGNTSVVLEYGL